MEEGREGGQTSIPAATQFPVLECSLGGGGVLGDSETIPHKSPKTPSSILIS